MKLLVSLKKRTNHYVSMLRCDNNDYNKLLTHFIAKLSMLKIYFFGVNQSPTM